MKWPAYCRWHDVVPHRSGYVGAYQIPRYDFRVVLKQRQSCLLQKPINPFAINVDLIGPSKWHDDGFRPLLLMVKMSVGKGSISR